MADNQLTSNKSVFQPLERSQLNELSPIAEAHTAIQLNLPKPDTVHDRQVKQTKLDVEVQTHQQNTLLAIEAPVALVINGIHYAVLMASPAHLDYLAFGFLFSEGLIEHRRDVLDWDVIAEPSYAGFLVEVTLSQRQHQRIQAQQRQLAGRTGCGMCGITGLSQALPDLSDLKRPFASPPSLLSLLDLRSHINNAQEGHLHTGAVHAAAAWHPNQKQQLMLFEDVGRHNALDKLIGWQLREGLTVTLVVMTSRLSIELAQKAIRAQMQWLVGMSAPTATALHQAQQCGLGLGGFLRGNRVTFYTPIS